MADAYGAIALPLAAPGDDEAATDPGLSLIGNYFAAVLNARAQTAWSVVDPPITGLATAAGPVVIPVVKTVYTHDPNEVVFNERDLPGLFLWRSGGAKPEWIAEDYRTTNDTVTCLWIFAPAQQQSRRIRRPFWNGVYKLLDRAIEAQRDPAFAVEDDPDPLAATVAAAPTAIKLSFDAPLADTDYTGASLDGATGHAAFATHQLPTVTVSGEDGAGTVLFTGLGADGEERTSRVDLGAAATYSGDWSLTQVTSVSIPAQQAGVTLTLGLGGAVGLGSNVVTLGAFQRIEVEKWAPRIVALVMGEDKSASRSYESLEISLRVEERWIRDEGTSGYGAALQFTHSGDNADPLATAILPND